MGKRGNNEGSIYKRKSDGRWVGAITDPITGRRKQFYGKTQSEVRKKLRSAQRAAEDRRPISTDRRRLSEYLDSWLEDGVKPSVRPKTYESYKQLVRLYLTPGLGHIRLGSLTTQDIQRFLNEKLESGLSARTVQYVRTVLRRALNQAEKWNLIPRNPAQFAEVPTVRPPKVEPFTPEEARRFLSAVKGHRLEALFVLAITTGLRQGELFGLAWGDLDLEAQKLHVRHTLERSNGQWRLSEPKTDRSRRTLDLPNITVDALQDHRVRQLEARLQAGPVWEEDAELVFTTARGTPLDGPNVNHTLHRILDQAGLRRQRFHDLRHAAASLLLAQGLQLREIMEVLGHSQITLTANLYTHLMPAMKKEAATRMDAVFAAS